MSACEDSSVTNSDKGLFGDELSAESTVSWH